MNELKEPTYEEAVEEMLVDLSKSEKNAWDKARFYLKRETQMWQAIGMYTKRINEAKNLKEAKFWNNRLTDTLCFMKDPELD